MRRVVAVLGVVGLTAAGVHGGEIDPSLEGILETANREDVVSTLVYLQSQVRPGELNDRFNVERQKLSTRHEIVVRQLQETARVSQPLIMARLNQLQAAGEIDALQPFWITNAIRVDATPATIRDIAARDDVLRVYFNFEIGNIDPVAEGPLEHGGTDAPEPGVEAIRAPEVWASGINGDGTLVATLDTGVDGDHPALRDRWRGVADPRYANNPEWAFFDPVTTQLFPFDSGNHGTHTMGTVCGGAPGDEVGVAPGAQWIHAAVIDRTGSVQQTVADAILAFEWVLDPDGDPATNWDVPDVCSNSWGVLASHGFPACDETFWTFLDACEAAGIVMVFSAGNESTSGLRRPADRATDEFRTLAVAAVDGNVPNWPIASFSSRGPTSCTPSGAQAIKPDISAPGVDVRSAAPGGGYRPSSGTSMASPHINGVVALMRQANPDMAVDAIKQVMYDTAFDLGNPGEDNAYGWGMVDAFDAVQGALSTVSLTISFPNGRPQFIEPTGGTAIRVVATGQAVQPAPGTGLLYYSESGGSFTTIPMVELQPNEYDAVFPAVACGATVDYYVSVETLTGELVFSPFSAPTSTYSAVAYSGTNVHLTENFENVTGWTVESTNLATGEWELGVPAGGGTRSDPPTDFDGSGQCYLTENGPGDTDVDGGPTDLISETFDLSALPDADFSYARWFASVGGTTDFMEVSISDDNGSSWTTVSMAAGSGGWSVHTFHVADFVTPNDQIKLRFRVSDQPNDSVVEAGIDALQISSLFCNGGIPGDVNGDGVVDVLDLIEVLSNWGPCPGCPADLNNDGVVDILDLLEVLGNWS